MSKTKTEPTVEWWAKSAIHLHYCVKGGKNCEWCINIRHEVTRLGIHEDKEELSHD